MNVQPVTFSVQQGVRCRIDNRIRLGVGGQTGTRPGPDVAILC